MLRRQKKETIRNEINQRRPQYITGTMDRRVSIRCQKAFMKVNTKCCAFRAGAHETPQRQPKSASFCLCCTLLRANRKTMLANDFEQTMMGGLTFKQFSSGFSRVLDGL